VAKPEQTRVLLVEDNPGDARLMRELVAEVAGAPFVLTVVGTHADGIQQVGGHEAVLLDLSLPDAHGKEAIEGMVAAAGKAPVIVLTGNTDEAEALAAAAYGADDYLLKNEVTPSLLGRAIWYAIERRRSAERERQVFALELATKRARFLGDLSTQFVADLNVEAIVQTVLRFASQLTDYCRLELEGTERDGGQVAVNDPSDDADRALSDARALVLPLVARDRRVGELRLASRTGNITAEAIVLAEEVAYRTATAIDSALLQVANQRAVRARDEMLAIVSHDLRNPLSVLSLTLHTTRELVEAQRPVRTDMIDRGVRAISAMQRLIDDLLDIARIDAGTLALNRTSFDMNELMAEAIELQTPLAAAKGISLARGLSERPVPVVADRARLAQVMANLLGNALKFTPQQGTITVSCEPTPEGCRAAVSDTGPGLPSAHLPHVFDRFYQVDRRGGGTGLGLAICKGIVERHGGRIAVESEPGRGASFWFTVPVGEQHATAG